MESKYRLGQKIMVIKKGEKFVGTITNIYKDYGDISEDGCQYDITDEKGRLVFGMPQFMNLMPSHRSSYKSDTMIEDAIEHFQKAKDVEGIKTYYFLQKLQLELKMERDLDDIALMNEGRI